MTRQAPHRPRRTCMNCGKRRLIAWAEGPRLCSECYAAQLSQVSVWEFAVKKTDPKTCRHDQAVTLSICAGEPNRYRCEQCGTEWPRAEDVSEFTITFT